MDIKNIIKNITPSVLVMSVGLLGAWLVYDNYFSDKISAAQVSTFQPAAGEETHTPALEEAVETATEAATDMTTEEAIQCMMDENGMPLMNEDGSGCIPAPMDETMMDETMIDETMMDETMMDETMMDETMMDSMMEQGTVTTEGATPAEDATSAE